MVAKYKNNYCKTVFNYLRLLYYLIYTKIKHKNGFEQKVYFGRNTEI